MSKIKFKDVAHLYLASGLAFSHPEKGILRFWAIGGEFVVSDPNFVRKMFDESEDEKPLLRPLASMTEEDARELYLVDFGDPYDNSEISALDWYNRRQFDELEDSRIEYTIGSPAGWLYLLNKGFDLFGLIESGEALDATKIGGQL